MQSFVKWFPNLSRLTLRQNQCVQSFTADPFEHLKHLLVIGLHNQNGFVADLMRGAHQLERLEIKIFGEQISRLPRFDVSIGERMEHISMGNAIQKRQWSFYDGFNSSHKEMT